MRQAVSAGEIAEPIDPLKLKTVRDLRAAVRLARGHALQADDGLEGVEAQAVRTIAGLLGLALKTMDGVKSFQVGDGAVPGPAGELNDSKPGPA